MVGSVFSNISAIYVYYGTLEVWNYSKEKRRYKGKGGPQKRNADEVMPFLCEIQENNVIHLFLRPKFNRLLFDFQI